jgi:hypothetical protein
MDVNDSESSAMSVQSEMVEDRCRAEARRGDRSNCQI